LQWQEHASGQAAAAVAAAGKWVGLRRLPDRHLLGRSMHGQRMLL
jgi:hypothetical protein